jgi:PAS domain S-box-containing protein
MLSEPLQIAQKSYRLLVESVKDYAIIMLDDTGHIVSWNRGAEQIKGYKAREIIGKHISIFYTREAVEKGEPERILQLTKELGRYEDEGLRVRKDGSVFWADVVLTALKDSFGNLVGFGKVTRDITQRKKEEEEISRLNKEIKNEWRKSQSEVLDYKHAIDEASIVAITDQKGRIKYVNENFCKISKYSRDELIGQDHRIINSGYHSKEFIRDLWTTIAHGKIWRGELKNKAKDGSYYWVDTTIIPFLNEQGKPYQYVALRNDITQRKLAEEQIIKINEELERKVNERTFELTQALEREKELSELKSRFVSIASHEFRTPLSAILSSVGLIDQYRYAGQEDKRQRHVERIKSSVRSLTEILNDFLSLDKLEQGKVEVHCTRFSIFELIQDAIEETDGLLKRKNQAIHYVYNEVVDVIQDERILRNVLLNLLSNAVKYSPEEKAIYVDAEVKGEMVYVSVRDEGIGIPEDAKEHLFSKFYRAENAGNIQGTGLGLNIVKRYMELLGGDISFISKENEGSTFTINFPLYKG